MSSSVSKPGPMVASSNSTPLGSRKYTLRNQKRSMIGVGRALPDRATRSCHASCSSICVANAMWWIEPPPCDGCTPAGGGS